MPNHVFPQIRYRDAKAASEWLQEAFGFDLVATHEDANGRIQHAEMRWGESMIMFGEETDEGKDRFGTHAGRPGSTSRSMTPTPITTEPVPPEPRWSTSYRIRTTAPAITAPRTRREISGASGPTTLSGPDGMAALAYSQWGGILRLLRPTTSSGERHPELGPGRGS